MTTEILVPATGSRRGQTGATTLIITMLLLIIVTIIVLFSSNVAFFEQRTASNQSRSQLAQKSAEYALGLSTEFLKANMTNLVSTQTGGWLASGASNRWTACSTVSPMAANHPCMAEADSTRRGNMYFYNFGGSSALPYASVTGALANAGGSGGSEFAVTTTVNALLCRMDTTLVVAGVTNPDCRLNPSSESGNRPVFTLVASTSIDQTAVGQVKESYATFSTALGTSSVPLVASGTVTGLGAAQIVASPNGGGVGFPVSVWSPCPIDLEKTGTKVTPNGCSASNNGNGSVNTCQLSEFLAAEGYDPDAGLTPMKNYCFSNNCNLKCPAAQSMSAGGSTKRESYDILDRDGGLGEGLEASKLAKDIRFFPTHLLNEDGTKMDSQTDPLDDSIFEWIFAQDVVPEDGSSVPSNCGSGGTENCALVALRDNLGATVVANCSGFNSSSSGLYYVTGGCSLPNAVVGSPSSPVIIVVNGDHADNQGTQGVRLGDTIYGMLFVRSNTGTAKLTGNGGIVFGSVVVEGTADLAGNVIIIYDSTSTDVPGQPLPSNTRFAHVAGSWLDNLSGF